MTKVFTLLSALLGLASASAQEPVTNRDRVYTANQFSNTVSVIDPSSDELLGEIVLGRSAPFAMNTPLYYEENLVHGLGYSPDGSKLVVVSIQSNSLTFIHADTGTPYKHVYLERAPHEAFFSPDGSEVWVTVRGDNYIAVVDAETFEVTHKISLSEGPGMTIFHPSGDYAFVCSSSSPLMHIVNARDHTLHKSVDVISPFCPHIYISNDGEEVYFTHKDIGYISFFNTTSMEVEATLETGPVTNHVVALDTPEGDKLLYITIGGLNAVKVYDRSKAPAFEFITQTAVGEMPHGIWPSGDDTKVYIGNENDDTVSVMETRSHSVTSVIKVGQNPQALVYVTNAISSEDPRNDVAELRPTIKSTAQTIELLPSDASTFAGGNLNFRGLATHEQGVTRISNAQPETTYNVWLTGDLELNGPSTLLAVLTTDGNGNDQKDFIVPMGSFQSTDGADAIFSRVLVLEAGSETSYIEGQQKALLSAQYGGIRD